MIKKAPPKSFNTFSQKNWREKKVTCDTWHVTRDTWHLTCGMLWGSEHSLKISAPYLLLLVSMIFWSFGGNSWLSDWINYEAVCRTGPDTPSLLKTQTNSNLWQSYIYICCTMTTLNYATWRNSWFQVLNIAITFSDHYVKGNIFLLQMVEQHGGNLGIIIFLTWYVWGHRKLY